MAKQKQITVRIGEGLDRAITQMIDNTNASQSMVVRAMLAYAADTPREVEAMIRSYRLTEI